MELLVKQRIKEVLKGDQSAYEEIVEIYKDKVFQLCFRMLGNRHEAEDMAQEAFVRAYVNIHTFNTNLKFSTWLYRIATNLCIDRIRKKKPDYYLDAEVAGTDGLDIESPEDQVESLELHDIIQREITKLPEKYRTVIVLKYIEELSLKEIGKVLDMPIGTIKTRIHRGREALRKQLSNI